MSKTDYTSIIKHYEDCFTTHGDNHLGVDWPNMEDALVRYAVMLQIDQYNMSIKKDEYTLLDFGCGAGIDVILAAHKVAPNGRVTGIDFSSEMIQKAKQAVKEAEADSIVDLNVAELDKTNLTDNSTDVVMSNCTASWLYIREIACQAVLI